MRTTRLSLIQRGALRLAGPALSLAGLAIVAAPADARAENNNNSNQCYSDWDCYAGWDQQSWCHQGQCKARDRLEEACKVPGNHNRCWWDGECNDGNPNTVNWCDDFDWSGWNWWTGGGAGRCFAAPVDGSACDPDNQTECRRNRDCRDNDPNTKNWCHQGRCYEADRGDATCAEEGSSCRRKWQCRDGDPNTFDWCYQSQCYHAPINGGSCEPGQGCVEADCPDDGNECTQAACENDQCAQQNVADGTSCDNGAGSCNAGTCQPVVTCVEADCPDDGNECTQAACVNDACAQENVNNGTECDNGSGTCNDGTCEPNNTCVEADCPDDGNECTQAACVNDACAQVNVNNGTECDNGSGACNDGTCEPVQTCDPATCPNDGNECTQAGCDSDDQCVQDNVDNGTSCNNGNGTCSDGACVQCTDASDCNDGNECTSSACSDAGECQFLPVADGGSCNGGAGVCIAGACADVCAPENCPDDGNDCTENICNADNSCGTQPVAAGNLCAGGSGTCDANGTCSVCMPSDCDDSNECTDESCNGANCESNNAPDGRSCNNGNGVCSAGECVGCIADSDCSDNTACNGAETCVNFECVAGTAVQCAEQDCKIGSCTEPDGDCNYTNQADGSSCANGSGTCQAGECNVCVDADCDDGNECTDNACNGAACATTNKADGTSCAGGSGTCEAGTCNVCEDSSCNDNNECTNDACDGAACAFTAVNDGTSCNNGNGVCEAGACVACITDSDCSNGVACDGTETCVNNECQNGAAVQCDDIACKAGSCSEPNGECTYTDLPDNTACSDGNGLCISGACTVCDPSDCGDTNECTASECDGSNQCVNNPVENGTACNNNQGQCNDGACVECVADADCGAATNCAQAPTCVNNSCVAGAPVVCPDDGNVCTSQSCDPATGCVTTNVADGTSCGDAGQTCQSGVCETPAPTECAPILVRIEHTRRGAVNSPGSRSQWKVVGNSYQIRDEFDVFTQQRGSSTRNYHCFDLSGVPAGEVLDAELEMTHSETSFQSDEPFEIAEFREMTNVECGANLDRPILDAPPNHQAIFDDLGTGTVIAQFTANEADNWRPEHFEVQPVGYAGIQAKLGSSSAWGIGGALFTPDPTDPIAGQAERIFRGSDESGGRVWPKAVLTLTIKPNSCASNTVSQTVVAKDSGYFRRGYVAKTGNDHPTENSDANTNFSDHWIGNPPDSVKRRPRVGPIVVPRPGGIIGVLDRRNYFVFDTSGITNAVSAKLRRWGYQASDGNAGSGVYSSADASEMFEVHALENFTAAQVLAAPHGQNTTHTLDNPIFQDLGDGVFLGQRRFTAADGTDDLVPSPTAPAGTVCGPNQPCGKYVDIPLNQAAVDAINATNGDWIIGGKVSTVNIDSSRQYMMDGNVVDLATTNSFYPAYLGVPMELVVEVANP